MDGEIGKNLAVIGGLAVLAGSVLSNVFDKSSSNLCSVKCPRCGIKNSFNPGLKKIRCGNCDKKIRLCYE